MCLFADKIIRPIIKDRRQSPRTGVEAERDLPTLLMNAKNVDGTNFTDTAIEVREEIFVRGILGQVRRCSEELSKV